jgi:hypothetical protein
MMIHVPEGLLTTLFKPDEPHLNFKLLDRSVDSIPTDSQHNRNPK